MNDFQNQVIDYLTEPGHPDRIKALKLLIGSSAYCIQQYAEEAQARKNLDVWLKGWEEDGTFCKDGIDRARKALIPETVKPTKKVIRALVDFTVEGDEKPFLILNDILVGLRGQTLKTQLGTVGGTKVLDAVRVHRQYPARSPAT